MPKRKQADQAASGPASSNKRSTRSSKNSASSSASDRPHRPQKASALSNQLYPEALLSPADEDDLLAEALEQERQDLLGPQLHATESSVTDEYADDDSNDEVGFDVDEDDNSEDEWQPPEKQAASTSRQSRPNKARNQFNDEEEDDEEDGVDADFEDDELVQALKISKPKSTAMPQTTTADKTNKIHTEKAPPDIVTAFDEEDPELDDQADRAQAEVEAAAAWAEVRKRQNPALQESPTPAPVTSSSLTSWLGKGPSASSSVAELAASLPMPTTCSAAQIVDRSSLFVGYVYPLTNNTSAYIATLLSHLTRVVHPNVAVSLLPPQFANAPANKRGSSHDMYACRVLQLKPGRTGESGPDDFSLQEEKEDDGERWGGDRVLKVAREEGGADVLVIVSRWYGGEMLGPVRFEHIENAARASLQKHMADEELEEYRVRIQYLDAQIESLKNQLRGQETTAQATATNINIYPDLDLQKGHRITMARQKALEALQKRLSTQTSKEAKTIEQVEIGAKSTVEKTSITPADPSLHEPSSEALLARQPDTSTTGSIITPHDIGLKTNSLHNASQDPTSPTVNAHIVKSEPIEGQISELDTMATTATPFVKREETESGLGQDGSYISEDAEDLTGWDELS